MGVKMRHLWIAAVLICCGAVAGAQNPESVHGIPADVYYLMPSFGQGTVYLRGQAPAQGRMNICAVDNTLHFIDKNGTELEAGPDIEILKVRIDSVVFIRHQNIFYRLFPFNDEMGVALQREVRVFHDVKRGAYGTVSQTTSVQEIGYIYADGTTHNLDAEKPLPYATSDLFFIYRDGSVFPFTRKGLRKVFPDKKDEIDAWFKAGHAAPKTVEEALGLLANWTQ